MAVVVITADYGHHDLVPRPPAPQTVRDVAWHYYTDRDERAPAPWVTHKVAGEYMDPQLSAKAYRCMPQQAAALGGCTDVVWIDANMAVHGRTFVADALAARGEHGIAAWKHPRRDCVYAEADAALGAESQGGKWEPYRAGIEAQMRHYLDCGYPAHNGLYATGTIAWDLAQPRARLVGSLWMDQCIEWSPMCQLSLPWSAWATDTTVATFPVPQLERRYGMGNRWLRILPHRAKEPR